MSIAVGIDIGGTKIAIGFVTDKGEVLAKNSLKTDLSVTPAEMMKRVAAEVERLAAEQGLAMEDLKGIGIGAPGPLDTVTGKLVTPPNMLNWWDFAVVDELAAHLTLPITLENDATAAALAEKWMGAGQDSDYFIFITISTGIGAGIYLHGKLITGATGNAGDVGHMIIDADKGIAGGKQAATWETLASGTAIARQASEILGKEVHTPEVFALAREGNEQMIALIKRVFAYLGMGVASLVNALDPERIIIGGGVSQVGEELFDAIRENVAIHVLNPAGQRVQIVPAGLNQDAGLIGAASLVHLR